MIVDILHLVALHLPELLCLVCLGTSCYIPLMVTWNLVRQEESTTPQHAVLLHGLPSAKKIKALPP